jgi:hypothetical protein
MVPAGGEGECLKVIQVENGTLMDLVEVFLGLSRGFDVPAGAVVLISSASHVAAVGAAEYATDYVRASGQLRGAYAGSVSVLHGVSFLLGGTGNTAAIRAIAEVELWIKLTSTGNDTISATRAIFMESLTTSTDAHDTQIIIRLPTSQTNGEKCTFVSSGLGNLKTAADPISEEFENYLLTSLVDELNNLFPVGLDTDFICDRHIDLEVFDDSQMDRTALVLIGASHLRNIGKFFDQEAWKVFDLTTPGWRVTDDAVREKTAQVKDLANEIDLKEAVCVLQLYDNSVYLVGGPGGVRHLPVRDPEGCYHVDGRLLVADKQCVKDLTATLAPLLNVLGESKKLVLTPLARYWRSTCCEDTAHVSNYREKNFLPKLNMAISGLRDSIRDTLYIRRIQNFRVLCPNKMIGLGPRQADISDSEAKEFAELWGDNPVHPSTAAYRKMAHDLEADLLTPEARYTNPVRSGDRSPAKKLKPDDSLNRASWVNGCPAALPRRDSAGRKPRGNTFRGSTSSARPARGGPAPRGHYSHRGRGYAPRTGWPPRGGRSRGSRRGTW